MTQRSLWLRRRGGRSHSVGDETYRQRDHGIAKGHNRFFNEDVLLFKQQY